MKMSDIEERRKKYNCDGYCYGCNTDLPKGHPDRVEMCPNVERCDATRHKEFFATVVGIVVALLLLLMSYLPVILLIGVWLYAILS